MRLPNKLPTKNDREPLDSKVNSNDPPTIIPAISPDHKDHKSTYKQKKGNK